MAERIYCVIDSPDRPTLETYVDVCQAQVQAYQIHGGEFNADSQRLSVDESQVVLSTEGSFPMIVQNAAGFVPYDHAGILPVMQTSAWSPT